MKNRKMRKRRIRSKIKGSVRLPRVVVFRSNTNLYIQAIDDEKGIIIAYSSNLKNKDLAFDLVKTLKAKKIKKIVFDRAGYKYHGKVKKITDDIKKAGLEF